MAGPGGEQFVAGQYLVSYAGVNVGIMGGDAELPTVEQVPLAQNIDNTDKYGRSLIDAVYQGANWFAQYTVEEYKAASLAAFWPFASLGLLGIIGRLYSAMAAPLVLTAIAGTPAAGSPNSLTANRAILAPGYNARLLYGPMLRKVPVRQVLLPYDTTGLGVYGGYTQT